MRPYLPILGTSPHCASRDAVGFASQLYDVIAGNSIDKLSPEPQLDPIISVLNLPIPQVQ
jgi:hypothetical protein